MDDKHFDDSADTLPTFDNNESSKPVGITRRTMLKDPEEEAAEKVDSDEEKSSIERKSAYDDLAQKEHFFSKANIEVDEEFEKQMLKKKELNEERREELIAKERRIKIAKLTEEIEEAKRLGKPIDNNKYLQLEALKESVKGSHKVQTNDLANELNRRISQGLHETTTELSENESFIRKGALGAIAVEIAFAFVFVPNQIFIFPIIVRYVLAIASVMLALIAIIVLIVAGNKGEEHVVPPKQNLIFLAATIFPGTMLRALFGTLLAKAFEFIPVAGIYIGYCLGIALGATMHYALLSRYHIKTHQATSIINSAVTIILFIIPNLISGTINQPMDQKSQFSYGIYLIEAAFIVVVDEIVYILYQSKKAKK